MHNSESYQLCIAYDWEYDKKFIEMVSKRAIDKKLSLYVVDEHNLDSTIQEFENNRIRFKYLFDRASDSSPDFLFFYRLLQKSGIPVFEPYERSNWATDKATMHLEFISNGINTPYSIIIPPYKEIAEIYISVADLAKLGRSFIIKPANTSGGGIGVVQGAETLPDVLSARQEYKNDKYLLQEMIHPLQKDGRSFWFRGFYTCGLIQYTWWDPETHVYEILKEEEVQSYELGAVCDIIKKIAEICGLKFFSTEIAVTTQFKFVVVDYVNITSDMRLKSIHPDGVPDEIVERVSLMIAEYIAGALGEQGE